VVVRAVLAAAGLVYASEVDHICSHFAGYMNPFFITSVLKNPPHFPLYAIFAAVFALWHQ
jgi:hypothetical protein